MPFSSSAKLRNAGKWIDAGKSPVSNRVGPSRKGGGGFTRLLDRAARGTAEGVGRNLKRSGRAAIHGRDITQPGMLKTLGKATVSGAKKVPGLLARGGIGAGKMIGKGLKSLGKGSKSLGTSMFGSDAARHRQRFNLTETEQSNLRKKFGKTSALTSPAQRAKMRSYRMANKAKLRRAAKIRRMKERTGARRKKKRIGSAAAGYSFVMDPESGPKFGGTNQSTTVAKGHKATYNFSPDKNPGSTDKKTTLRPL